MKVTEVSQVGPITIDFTGLGKAIVDALLTGIQVLLGSLPQKFEEWLLGVIQGIISAQASNNLLTQNPLQWLTRDPDVNSLFLDLWPLEAGIAVLVLAIQAFRIMNGKIELWEAIFRTAFFVIMGDGTLLWTDHILNIFNLAAAFVAGNQIFLTDQKLPTSLEFGFVLIIGALFAVFAWIKGAVGVVFLKVLIVVAPVFLPLSALPLLEGLGTWWGEEFTVWTLRPFMVALALRLGLGQAAREQGIIGLLFVLVSFWLAWTMDTRIRRFSMGAWGSVSHMGAFARAARFAAGAFSGGATTAAAAAAASPAPAAAGSVAGALP